jgi:AraC-like DNA-binding protein
MKLGIPLDVPAILCLLGVGQALLLALVLITSKHGNRAANGYLAAIALAISISVIANVVGYVPYFQVSPHLSRINHPLDFLPGPLLFLYVNALIFRSSAGKKALLHFVPAVLCFLYLVPFYLLSAEDKRAALLSPNWYYARAGLAIPLFLVYLVFIIGTLVRFSRKIKRQKSTSYEKAAQLQIRCLVVSFFVLWILAISRYAVDLLYPEYRRETVIVLPLGATLIVYLLGYLALKNSGAFESGQLSAEKKYETSTLTPEQSARYLKRLQHAMEPEKAYTDGNLTLQKLSTKLSIPVQHLSQVVNEQLNQNILDFINMHRVEEVKRRLVDADLKHLSILAIAEDVGFNSKSSFNAVFKKYVNITPSEFRNAAFKQAPETSPR